MSTTSENSVWEHKEIKFDTPNVQKHLRNGELVLYTIHHVDDAKGNPTDMGCLLATNLRLIWYSVTHKKFNISIGYECISNTTTRNVCSKVFGTVQGLYILAISNKTRFEFIFTDASGISVRRNEAIFSRIFEIFQLFQRTYLYREIKLRASIIHIGQLIILPKEQVFNRVHGVWNLSSDQGNLGLFIITNIRLVWFADANETFNITLPYLQISNVCIRDSKYGPALVVQTALTGGGYVLGFRIDPLERLREIFKELLSLHSIYAENPNFGVQYNINSVVEERKHNYRKNQEDAFKVEEFHEIDERQQREVNTKLNTYLAEGTIAPGMWQLTRQPIYCKEIGFAMERIRDGYKLNDLWDILPTEIKTDEAQIT